MFSHLVSLSLRRNPCPARRACACEPLEIRALLSVAGEVQPISSESTATAIVASPAAASMDDGMGGMDSMQATVTPTQIITESDTIPRFAAQPTITNVRGGNWSDPSIWSLGRVPGAADRVAIAESTVVSYATVSNARLNALEIDGSLIFSTTVNTRLTVGTIEVMPTGTLQIGTALSPVAAGVKAEIVIADQPLDLVNDPLQFGNGLLVFGTIDIHGAPSNETWSQLATEPRAGDTSLFVSGPAPNWHPGDVLLLPDSRQVLTTDADEFLQDDVPPEWEQVTVSAVSGNRIYLQTALQFDHLGARNSDGGLELLPDVAILNRNVVVRSENPAGVRGHTFFTGRASVDIEYARFQDLGRTSALVDLDSTTLDTNGNVTHVGTNQIGRYAVHFHHLMGPENPTNTGYQFKFIGNTVDGSKK